MNQNAFRTITPQEARDLLQRKEQEYLLLDVRSVGEFSGLHALEAINMPLHTIASGTLQSLKGKKVICICQKGGRGEQAANTLCQNGFTDVCNVDGGTEAWEKAGLAVHRGESCISLERQVRIAAGSFVVLGIVFGYLYTPYAVLLSLFVGCGLIFSGITNTCGMGLLLTRCPWNSK